MTHQIEESDATTKTLTTILNDVVLIVVENLDIDAFLEFRLTSRRYYNLIGSHMNSLTLAVASATFPNQSRIFTANPRSETDEQWSPLQWLKWLRFEQLAAILVERRGRHSIAAEDSLGDGVRSAAAKGWHVLVHLARIAEQAKCLTAEQAREGLPGCHQGSSGQSTDPKYEPLQARMQICLRWMRYVQTWTLAELQGYEFVMETMVHDALDFPGQAVWEYDTVVNGIAWRGLWVRSSYLGHKHFGICSGPKDVGQKIRREFKIRDYPINLSSSGSHWVDLFRSGR